MYFVLYLQVFFSYDVPHTHALVAQLDRVQVSETWGRGFDPRRAHQLLYNNFSIYLNFIKFRLFYLVY